MAVMAFESPTVRIRMGCMLLGMFAALWMMPLGLARADEKESSTEVRFELDLVLLVSPSGAIKVTQTYNVMDGSPVPDELSIWIRGTERPGFFYEGLGLEGVYVYSDTDEYPLVFTSTKTTNGIRVEISDLIVQLRESESNTISVGYILKNGFRGTAYRGDFFDQDELPGPVYGVSVSLEEESAGKGELFLADGSSASIIDAKGQRHSMDDEESPDAVVLKRYGQSFGSKIQLKIHDVMVAELPLGGEEFILFDFVGFMLPNLWFVIPFVFLLFLVIRTVIYGRARTEQMASVEPLAKAPAGMDASSAAAICYGGICKRLYSATLISLAHQQKVLIEQDDTSGALSSLLIRRQESLGEESKAAERVLFDRILFTRSETESLARVHTKLHRNFLGMKLRWGLRENFSRRQPIIRSPLGEWWLWPKTYRIMMVILFLGGGALLMAGAGIGLTSIAKPEWWFAWPVMMVAFVIFLATARWGRTEFQQHEMPFLQFLAFLERNPDKLAKIAGDTRGFSVLLPYGLATGTERQIIDAYCHEQERVGLPKWLFIKGNTLDTVHVNVFRDRFARIIEALNQAF